MKILVSSKGGHGKSMISAILGKYLASMDHRVLITYTDKPNPRPYRMLELSKVKTLVEHLKSKMRGKILMVAEGKGELDEELFNWTLKDIPREILARKGNLAVFTIRED